MDLAPGPGWSTPSRAPDRSSAKKSLGRMHEVFFPCPKVFHLTASAYRVQHLSLLHEIGWNVEPSQYGLTLPEMSKTNSSCEKLRW